MKKEIESIQQKMGRSSFINKVQRQQTSLPKKKVQKKTTKLNLNLSFTLLFGLRFLSPSLPSLRIALQQEVVILRQQLQTRRGHCLEQESFLLYLRLLWPPRLVWKVGLRPGQAEQGQLWQRRMKQRLALGQNTFSRFLNSEKGSTPATFRALVQVRRQKPRQTARIWDFKCALISFFPRSYSAFLTLLISVTFCSSSLVSLVILAQASVS